MSSADPRPPALGAAGAIGCLLLGHVFLAAGVWALRSSAAQSSMSEAVIAAVCGLWMFVLAAMAAQVAIWNYLYIRFRDRYDAADVPPEERRRADRRRRLTGWAAYAVVAVAWVGAVALVLPPGGWKCLAPPLPPPDRTEEIQKLRAEVESLRKDEQELRAAAERAFAAYREAEERSKLPWRPGEGFGPAPYPLWVNYDLLRKQLNGVKTRLQRTEKRLAETERAQNAR